MSDQDGTECLQARYEDVLGLMEAFLGLPLFEDHLIEQIQMRDAIWDSYEDELQFVTEQLILRGALDMNALWVKTEGSR